jgi:hypothetical protein
MLPRRLCVLALAGLVAWAGPGWAQVNVRAPGVRVAVDDPPGPGPSNVYVRVPFIGVVVGSPPPPPPVVVTPPPVVVQPVPPPAVVVQPAPPPVVVQPAPQPALLQPLTPAQFAQVFRPAAGTYEAILVHPLTKVPVRVSFTLPPGTPRVTAGPRFVEFDYGHTRVIISFVIGGGVRVRTV